MATGGELNGAEGGSRANPAPDGRISGLGKIIYVAENCGLLYSTNKQKIYFGERHFHPFVKGILGTLERGSYLHFEARQTRKGGTKLTYSATKVWRQDVNESLESNVSKKKEDGAVTWEAINFLRSILDVQLSLNLSSLCSLLSDAPQSVQDMLSSEKDIRRLLKRFPSVFQYSAAGDAVSLVDETVHCAIDCVVDLFKDDSCLDLGFLFRGVTSAPREIRQQLGYNEVDFLKFLKQYQDVFQLSKRDKDGSVSVSLRLSSAAESACAADSYDTQSVGSSCSQDTCSSSSGVRMLSSALSVLSLDALSELHEPTGTNPSPDGPAKQRGIEKLLNALANKEEPMSLGSLIGYIHSSPPDVRDAIGNKMDKFTEFIRNDDNFLLLEPHNLVFVRNSVEKKALECLVSIVTKRKTVKLTDLLSLLKSDYEKAPAAVMALFGNEVSEISAAVRKLLTRQELVPSCNLVLQNDLLSIKSSSHHEFNSKSIVNDSTSTTVVGDKVPNAAYCVPGEDIYFSPACEDKGVDFLRSILQRHKLLPVLNVGSHLVHVSTEIQQLLGSEKLIRDFVKRHPSVFKSLATEDVIQLVDDNVRVAVEFFSSILTSKGDLPISSLIGHYSSASASIRLATGGSLACVTEFLKRHFDVFRVYEGNKGSMAALVRQKSPRQFDLSSVKRKIDASVQCPAPVGLSLVQPATVYHQKDVSRKADNRETGTCSDEPELEFLVNLLKSRGVMRLKDVVRCVSNAPVEIQDDLGRGDDEVLSYIEENPAVFKVSQGGQLIELVSEDAGDAIEFYLDVLNKRGATPVSKIHGHLSQAADSIRKVTGGSPESVTSFLLSFPNVFRKFRDGVIEKIESLYEGRGDSGDSLPSSDAERSPPKLKLSHPGAVTLDEAASKFDEIDFGSLVGLSLLNSNVNAAAAASESISPDVSSLVSGAIQVQESSALHGAQFSERAGTNSSNDSCESELSFVECSCSSHSQKPISDTFVAFDKNDHLESQLFDNFQVEMASGTPPGVNVPSSEKLQSRNSQLEILSVINLVRSAVDEQNVVADLCYETFSSRMRGGGGGGRRGSLGTGELLSICRLADPLDRKWQTTLSLKCLNEILEADGRFVANKTNRSVFLRKDVERKAVEFLQNCIHSYGPIKLVNLKHCDYLRTAGTEVKAVLSKGNSSKFKRSLINSLGSKYRDQLNQEDGFLVVPSDVETLSIAFLSQLIETLGPIPVDVFLQNLLHAPVEVSRFFEGKCCLGGIKSYLSSLNLAKHFIVVEDTVDLVRSGNLDKNRLVVEQQAVAFLVDVIQTHGPILLNGKKVNYLMTAPPAVRQLLGKEWNACFCKNKLLKKLCLKRSEVFVVGKKTIGLVGSAVEEASRDTPTSAAAADSGFWNSESARDVTLEFLLGLMRNDGMLDLRLKELKEIAIFAAPPQVRILLGGEMNSVQLKKKLVVAFCSSYPEIFTVNRKSVVLNRTRANTRTPIVLGYDLKPTSHSNDDAFIDSSSVSFASPAKGVAQETTRDVRHVACPDIPTCIANQPLNAANISTASVSVFDACMTNNYGLSTLISSAHSLSRPSQGIAATCLQAVTPVANGSLSEDLSLASQSSDENENLETSELSNFHCRQLLSNSCLPTDSDVLLEKNNINNTDDKHLKPDSLSALSSVSLSSENSARTARAMASCQKSSVPINWSSKAMMSQVLNFREEFDRPLGDLCQYIDLLHADALKSGSLAADDDFGNVWHSNDDEQGDGDAVGKSTGTVLSAEGSLLYIKCEDGRLVSCSSKNCFGRFNRCQNIGRHFATGEKVSVISERLSKRLSVRRSSSGARRDEDQDSEETASRLEAADDVCCSETSIKSGRGRVSILSSDVIAVMMGSLEMAAFKGRHSCKLLPNDVVSFTARRAQSFMAPWRLDDIRRTDHPDGNTGRGFSAEFTRLNSTNDFSCQAHLNSTSSIDGDVIEVSERDSVDDDVIASASATDL